MSSSRTYYTTIERYHDLAEATHADQMFDASLIRGFVVGSVLDIGAGTGFNAQLFAIPSERYIGADFSRIGLLRILEKNRGAGVVADAALLPFRDGACTTLLCSWSLEHFESPAAVFEEMLRVTTAGGCIVIWGPNWDNILRKDFPQFAHKSRLEVEMIRLKTLMKMIRNEVPPFRYNPYVNQDVAAFRFPEKHVGGDTDAVHAVLCQETVKFFTSHGCPVLFLADFSMMKKHVRNGSFIRFVRWILCPLLPIIKHIPLMRWMVARFPLVVEIPASKPTARHGMEARPG